MLCVLSQQHTLEDGHLFYITHTPKLIMEIAGAVLFDKFSILNIPIGGKGRCSTDVTLRLTTHNQVRVQGGESKMGEISGRTKWTLVIKKQTSLI